MIYLLSKQNISEKDTSVLQSMFSSLFISNKTSQALDDVPKDHLHGKKKRSIHSFDRLNTHQWLFLSCGTFFDTSAMLGLSPAIVAAVTGIKDS